MANSKKPTPSNLLRFFQQRLTALNPAGRPLTVALSGGMDSVVLFDLLLQQRQTMGFDLSAVHINHQISPNAANWAAFCTALCQQHQIPIQVKKVQVARRAKQGLEAAARTARYQAFAEIDADVLLLAHHLDDQAETQLHHLLRGTGVRGAAGMDALRNSPYTLARPLIEVPRSVLLGYAEQRQLRWVEDESNADTRLTRNFLRHHVLPQIEQRFPAYRQTLARAAQHFSEADALLDELATLDAVHAVQAEKLNLRELSKLSPARARNLMRAYLNAQGITQLDTECLQEWLRQLLTARSDSRVQLGVAGFVLRRYRQQAWLELSTLLPAPDWLWPWQGESEIKLPALGGSVSFIETTANGIALDKLQHTKITLRLRQGGEKFQPDCNRPRKTLKHLLQNAAIPPWQRERLPLLFCGDELVAVPGIGIDCAYQSRPGEAALKISWARF